MNTILVSLLILLAPPVTPVDKVTALTPVAKICTDIDQRPMMGDPQGPPVVCLKDDAADFPLKHGPCGIDCTTHVPTHAAAEPKIPVRLDLTCQKGNVKALSYQIQGQQKLSLQSSNTGSSSVARETEIRPFSKTEVAAACEKALGGSWPKAGKHANAKQSVETKLEKKIALWGGCTGPDPVPPSTFRIRLTVTCVDQDF